MHRDLGFSSAKRASRSRLRLRQKSIEISAPAQQKEHRDLGSGSAKKSIKISAQPKRASRSRLRLSQESIEISAQPKSASRSRLSQKEHRDLGSGSAKRASRSRLSQKVHQDLGSAKKSIKISAPAQPKEYRDLGLKNSASGMSRLWLCRENFCLVKGRDHRKGKFLGEKSQTGWKNLPRKIGINTPSSPLFFVSSLHPRSIPFTQTKLYFC